MPPYATCCPDNVHLCPLLPLLLVVVCLVLQIASTLHMFVFALLAQREGQPKRVARAEASDYGTLAKVRPALLPQGFPDASECVAQAAR